MSTMCRSGQVGTACGGLLYYREMQWKQKAVYQFVSELSASEAPEH